MARTPIDINNIDLSQYELAGKPVAAPTNEQPDALRTLGRTAARGIESVVGLPGDIASGVLGAGNYLTGGKIPTYEEVQGNLPASAPTSAQVRKGTERLTGEYLKPRNRNEELYDEFIGDLATLALPVKGKIPFKGALTKALGANLAGYAAEQIGGEGLGKGAKIAYFLGSGIFGGRNALKEIQDNSYRKAEDLIAPIKKSGYASSSLNEKLKDVSKWTKAGVGSASPDKKLVSELLEKVKEHGKSGRISVNQLVESKKDMNALLRDPYVSKTAKDQIKRASGILNSEIEAYGKSSNPEFLKFYREADNINKGLNQTSKVNAFLQDNFNLDQILTSKIVKGLFASKLYGVASTPFAVGTAAAGNVASKVVKFGELLANSSEARKYYANVLKSAASENKNAVAQNLARLNSVAEDYEQKNPSSRQPIDINSIDLSQYELA